MPPTPSLMFKKNPGHPPRVCRVRPDLRDSLKKRVPVIHSRRKSRKKLRFWLCSHGTRKTKRWGEGVAPTHPPSFLKTPTTPHPCRAGVPRGAVRICCFDERTRRFKHPTRTIPGIYTSAPATMGSGCVPDVCGRLSIRHEPVQEGSVHGQIYDDEAEVRAARPAAAGSGFFRPVASPGQAPAQPAAGYGGWP